ncbi:MAG: reductive dehalogenase domain-containing protein [Acidobacteriota bacterium]
MVFAVLSTFFFLVFFLFSLFEKEWRASLVSFLSITINLSFWIFLIKYSHIRSIFIFNIIIIIVVLFLSVLSFVKYFPAHPEKKTEKIKKYDERDHMFSRNNLNNHQNLRKKYYKKYPEKEKIDKKIGKFPNLGEKGSTFYDKYYSPVIDAAFSVLDRTGFLTDGSMAIKKQKTDPEKITEAIRFIAKYYGAVDIGITELKDFHFYSHHGRKSENWGKKVENTHKYGIAIIVKMDIDQIKHSPALPVLLESSKEYVESAKIAHIIAEYIRGFGFSARSHVDGNYDLLAVPLAADCGLGEVGRMGILIHKKLGPAVRISAVTTDIPLQTSVKQNFYIEEFCDICKKCALNCPTGSISEDGKSSNRGFEHWSVNQEKCYTFWRRSGTDCAFCIRVCPYTKKDTLLHNFVRFYISRNRINQRIALFFDDIFYGRKFKIKKKNPKITAY